MKKYVVQVTVSFELSVITNDKDIDPGPGGIGIDSAMFYQVLDYLGELDEDERMQQEFLEEIAEFDVLQVVEVEEYYDV